MKVKDLDTQDARWREMVREQRALRDASRIFHPRTPITRRWWFEPIAVISAVMGVGFAVYLIASQ